MSPENHVNSIPRTLARVGCIRSAEQIVQALEEGVEQNSGARPRAAAASRIYTTVLTASSVELSRQCVVRVWAYLMRTQDGLTLGLYPAERSLIDRVRLRHREGAEIAWGAPRNWLRQKGGRLAALIEMVRSHHGAESTVRYALEIIL